MSKDLSAIIPTLDVVKGALSVAKSWLTKSKPILVSDLSMMPVSNSLLRVDTLKSPLGLCLLIAGTFCKLENTSNFGYGYCKNHKKTVKSGQTRTRERIECTRAGSF
ncbi:hypothetical protein Tco_0025995 [Tanacetum coccineum]